MSLPFKGGDFLLPIRAEIKASLDLQIFVKVRRYVGLHSGCLIQGDEDQRWLHEVHNDGCSPDEAGLTPETNDPMSMFLARDIGLNLKIIPCLDCFLTA